jgi:methylthioribulose-1-phosphate dehydratase
MKEVAFNEIAVSLTEIGRLFYSRGWVLGTSGNFSAVVTRDPLRLAMSPSGADKGSLSPIQILLIDEKASLVGDHTEKPSAESPLHVRIVTKLNAGAVLHTHSVWSTTLSDVHASNGGLAIEGYEMLKGLANVKTHAHREWLPILENSQDMSALADTISETLDQTPESHGLLIRRHGLYTWGKSLDEAKRHVEIFEFLLEATGRSRILNKGE